MWLSDPAALTVGQTYSLTAMVADRHSRETAAVTIQIVAAPNRAPEFDEPSYSFDVPLDSISNFLVGTLTATDADNDSLSFYDDGNAYPFSLSSNGQLRLSDHYYLSVGQTYTFTATVADQISQDTVTVSIHVTAPLNQPPEFGQPSYSFDVPLDSISNFLVGTLTATDPENNSLSFYDDGNAYPFSLSSNGQLRLSDNYYLSVGQTYTFTATVADQYGQDTATVTIHVTAPVNQPPAFNQPSYSYDVPIDSVSNLLVGTLTATDPENNSLSFYDDGNAYPFSLSSNGQLRLSDTYYLSVGQTYTFMATVADQYGQDTATVTIHVTAPVNQPPAFNQPSYSYDVPLDSVSNFLVGTLTATDPENNSLSFYDDGNAFPFSLNSNGQLRLSDNYYLSIGQTYTFTATVADQFGQDTATVTIHVTAPVNQPPAFNQPSYSYDVPLDSASNFLVGTLSATDPENNSLSFYDDGNAFPFSLGSNGQLRLSDNYYLSIGQTYTFTATVADQFGQDTATVTIHVTAPVNQPPAFNQPSYSYDVRVDAASNFLVATLTATDPENNSLSFSDDGNAYPFSLSSNGQLRLSDNYSLSIGQTYTFTATVTDQYGQDTATVTIHIVAAVNEPPEFDHPSYSFDLPVNSASNFLLATLTATDPENDLLTFSDDGEAAPFVLSSNGELRLSDNSSLEIGQTYTFEAKVADEDGEDTVTVTIHVTAPPNQAPVFSQPSYAFEVDIDAESGTVIGTVTATDPENNTLTWSSSNLPGAFQINSSTGAITLANPAALVSGTTYSFTVTVADQGHSVSKTVTIKAVDSSLDLAGDILGDATSLTGLTGRVGDRVGNGLQGNRDVDLYAITLNAGDSIRLDIDAAALDDGSTLSSLNSHLSLFDGSGVLLVANANGTDPQTGVAGTDSVLTFTALVSGTYYIGVSGAGNESYTINSVTGRSVGSTGAYELQYDVTPYVALSFAESTLELTLPESASANTLLATVAALGGQPGSLVYSAQSWPFSVNATNGQVRLYDAGSLIAGTEYTFDVTASDGYSTAVISVTVSIAEPANSAPVFSSSSYPFTIPRDVTVNSTVGAVSATDVDDDFISYSRQSGSSLFQVDVDGTIRVTSVASLAVGQTYTLQVAASDGTASSTATVTITIGAPLNAPPEFSSSTYNFELPSNPTSGLAVGTAAATDPELDLLTYSSTNLPNGFALNSSTGAITVQSPLLISAGQTYTFTVEVRDQYSVDTATVTIHVASSSGGGSEDPVQDESEAEDDDFTLYRWDDGRSETLDVLSNDYSASGLLTIVSASFGSGSGYSIPSGAVLSIDHDSDPYTPDTLRLSTPAGFTGTVQIYYTVEDADGNQSSATAYVTVDDLSAERFASAGFAREMITPYLGEPELGTAPSVTSQAGIGYAFLSQFPDAWLGNITASYSDHSTWTRTFTNTRGETFSVTVAVDSELTRTATGGVGDDWAYAETLISSYSIVSTYSTGTGITYTLTQTGSNEYEYTYSYTVGLESAETIWSLEQAQQDSYTSVRDFDGTISEEDQPAQTFEGFDNAQGTQSFSITVESQLVDSVDEETLGELLSANEHHTYAAQSQESSTTDLTTILTLDESISTTDLTAASSGGWTRTSQRTYQLTSTSESLGESYTYDSTASESRHLAQTTEWDQVDAETIDVLTKIAEADESLPIDAVDDSATIYGVMSIAAGNAVANDHKPTGEFLVELVTGPTHGTLTLLPDGNYTYEPISAEDPDADSFTYRLTVDGKSDTATVWIYPESAGVTAAHRLVATTYAKGTSIVSTLVENFAAELDFSFSGSRAKEDGVTTLYTAEYTYSDSGSQSRNLDDQTAITNSTSSGLVTRVSTSTTLTVETSETEYEITSIGSRSNELTGSGTLSRSATGSSDSDVTANQATSATDSSRQGIAVTLLSEVNSHEVTEQTSQSTLEKSESLVAGALDGESLQIDFVAGTTESSLITSQTTTIVDTRPAGTTSTTVTAATGSDIGESIWSTTQRYETEYSYDDTPSLTEGAVLSSSMELQSQSTIASGHRTVVQGTHQTNSLDQTQDGRHTLLEAHDFVDETREFDWSLTDGTSQRRTSTEIRTDVNDDEAVADGEFKYTEVETVESNSSYEETNGTRETVSDRGSTRSVTGTKDGKTLTLSVTDAFDETITAEFSSEEGANYESTTTTVSQTVDGWEESTDVDPVTVETAHSWSEFNETGTGTFENHSLTDMTEVDQGKAGVTKTTTILQQFDEVSGLTGEASAAGGKLHIDIATSSRVDNYQFANGGRLTTTEADSLERRGSEYISSDHQEVLEEGSATPGTLRRSHVLDETERDGTRLEVRHAWQAVTTTGTKLTPEQLEDLEEEDPPAEDEIVPVTTVLVSAGYQFVSVGDLGETYDLLDKADFTTHQSSELKIQTGGGGSFASATSVGDVRALRNGAIAGLDGWTPTVNPGGGGTGSMTSYSTSTDSSDYEGAGEETLHQSSSSITTYSGTGVVTSLSGEGTAFESVTPLYSLVTESSQTSGIGGGGPMTGLATQMRTGTGSSSSTRYEESGESGEAQSFGTSTELRADGSTVKSTGSSQSQFNEHTFTLETASASWQPAGQSASGQDKGSADGGDMSTSGSARTELAFSTTVTIAKNAESGEDESTTDSSQHILQESSETTTITMSMADSDASGEGNPDSGDGPDDWEGPDPVTPPDGLGPDDDDDGPQAHDDQFNILGLGNVLTNDEKLGSVMIDYDDSDPDIWIEADGSVRVTSRSYEITKPRDPKTVNYSISDGVHTSSATVTVDMDPNPGGGLNAKDDKFADNGGPLEEADGSTNEVSSGGQQPRLIGNVFDNDDRPEGSVITSWGYVRGSSSSYTLNEETGEIRTWDTVKAWAILKYTLTSSDGSISDEAYVFIGEEDPAPLPPPPPPNARNDRFNSDGSAVSGNVGDNDTLGDSYGFYLESSPSAGELEFNTLTGAFTYTPYEGYYGYDEFTYGLTGAMDKATVRIKVVPPDAPTVPPDIPDDPIPEPPDFSWVPDDPAGITSDWYAMSMTMSITITGQRRIAIDKHTTVGPVETVVHQDHQSITASQAVDMSMEMTITGGFISGDVEGKFEMDFGVEMSSGGSISKATDMGVAVDDSGHMSTSFTMGYGMAFVMTAPGMVVWVGAGGSSEASSTRDWDLEEETTTKTRSNTSSSGMSLEIDMAYYGQPNGSIYWKRSGSSRASNSNSSTRTIKGPPQSGSLTSYNSSSTSDTWSASSNGQASWSHTSESTTLTTGTPSENGSGGGSGSGPEGNEANDPTWVLQKTTTWNNHSGGYGSAGSTVSEELVTSSTISGESAPVSMPSMVSYATLPQIPWPLQGLANQFMTGNQHNSGEPQDVTWEEVKNDAGQTVEWKKTYRVGSRWYWERWNAGKTAIIESGPNSSAGTVQGAQNTAMATTQATAASLPSNAEPEVPPPPPTPTTVDPDEALRKFKAAKSKFGEARRNLRWLLDRPWTRGYQLAVEALEEATKSLTSAFNDLKASGLFVDPEEEARRRALRSEYLAKAKRPRPPIPKVSKNDFADTGINSFSSAVQYTWAHRGPVTGAMVNRMKGALASTTNAQREVIGKLADLAQAFLEFQNLVPASDLQLALQDPEAYVKRFAPDSPQRKAFNKLLSAQNGAAESHSSYVDSLIELYEAKIESLKTHNDYGLTPALEKLLSQADGFGPNFAGMRATPEQYQKLMALNQKVIQLTDRMIKNHDQTERTTQQVKSAAEWAQLAGGAGAIVKGLVQTFVKTGVRGAARYVAGAAAAMAVNHYAISPAEGAIAERLGIPKELVEIGSMAFETMATVKFAKWISKIDMCFVAGTPIHTPEGLRAIETLRVGDLVLTRPESSGTERQPTTYKRVVQTIVTHPDQLVRVEVRSSDGETDALTCTLTHPFYVSQQDQFVPAGEMQIGDAVILPEGRTALVSALTKIRRQAGETLTTYNFEVEECHTYFAGRLGVWVHNTGELCKALEGLMKADLDKGVDFDTAWNQNAAKLRAQNPEMRKAEFEAHLADAWNRIDKSELPSGYKPDLTDPFSQKPIPEWLQNQTPRKAQSPTVANGAAKKPASPLRSTPRTEPDPNWNSVSSQTKDTAKNAEILRKNMQLDDMRLTPHHIVNSTSKTGKFPDLRKVMDEYNIDINASENGVPLGKTQVIAKELGVRAHLTGSPSLHSERASHELWNRVEKITSSPNLSWGEKREAILNLLINVGDEILQNKFP